MKLSSLILLSASSVKAQINAQNVDLATLQALLNSDEGKQLIAGLNAAKDDTASTETAAESAPGQPVAQPADVDTDPSIHIVPGQVAAAPGDLNVPTTPSTNTTAAPPITPASLNQLRVLNPFNLTPAGKDTVFCEFNTVAVNATVTPELVTVGVTTNLTSNQTVISNAPAATANVRLTLNVAPSVNPPVARDPLLPVEEVSEERLEDEDEPELAPVANVGASLSPSSPPVPEVAPVEQDAMLETPVQAPVETPAEVPVETPVQAPVDSPVQVANEAPVESVQESSPAQSATDDAAMVFNNLSPEEQKALIAKLTQSLGDAPAVDLKTANTELISGQVDAAQTGLSETPLSEQPSESPAAVEPQAPVETPIESPVQSPLDTLVETPVENPVENPAETPLETPLETPVETPVINPAETATQAPVASPAEIESPVVGEAAVENVEEPAVEPLGSAPGMMTGTNPEVYAGNPQPESPVEPASTESLPTSDEVDSFSPEGEEAAEEEQEAETYTFVEGDGDNDDDYDEYEEDDYDDEYDDEYDDDDDWDDDLDGDGWDDSWDDDDDDYDLDIDTDIGDEEPRNHYEAAYREQQLENQLETLEEEQDIYDKEQDAEKAQYNFAFFMILFITVFTGGYYAYGKLKEKFFPQSSSQQYTPLPKEDGDVKQSVSSETKADESWDNENW